ncbi:MAG: DinB family protein [Chloroflexota bacterium]
MTDRKIPKPASGEFPPYASMYINLLPDDGHVLQHLEQNVARVQQHIETLPAEKLVTPHAPNEWTVKEILVHIIDDERIYAYRALRFAREDKTILPGFDQDTYIRPSKANQRDLQNIFQEYRAVRMSTITLFESFDDEALMRSGIADGNPPVTVRALLYHIAGHELHHLESIQTNYG